jgi:hypothetical protein
LDLIKESGKSNFDDDELKIAYELVGKCYSSVTVYESEDKDIDSYPLVYFEVVIDEIQYGAESMGDGELSMLYLMYRLKRSEENELYLIEEPETRTPDNRHESIIGYIGKMCRTNRLSAIVSTHSSQIRTLLMDEAKFRINCFKGKRSIISEDLLPPQRRQLISTKRKYFLSEDLLAIGILQQIIDDDSSDFEATKISGSGNLIKFLDATPREFLDCPSYPIIAVFDGDEEPKMFAKHGHKPWWDKICFLPGDRRFEAIFKDTFHILIPELSAKLGIAETVLQNVAGQLDGQDDHDWLTNLSAELNPDYIALSSVIFEAWCNKCRPSSEDKSRMATIRKLYLQ